MFHKHLVGLILILSFMLSGVTNDAYNELSSQETTISQNNEVHEVAVENDDLNEEELKGLISLIDTSNFLELLSVMMPTINVPEKINHFDLLKAISNSTPKASSPKPALKVVFANDHASQPNLLTNNQPIIITDNSTYLKSKHKEYDDNELDEWKGFSWEQWEEAKDPLAYLKSPPYVDGFGELKLYSLQVNADNQSRAYALNDEVYQYLTKKIKEVDFQIDYRFNLLIQAKISEEAEVYYNVSQEPDMPQKTDVSLKVRQTWVNFGYSEKRFNLGSFTDVSKKIDGISVEGNEGAFTYKFAFGSEKSKTDSFSQQGNGSDEYELRNKPVLEKSVQVWVNDVLQVLNKDYTVNYFEGKIIFATTKTSSDTLRFSYQFTNPIEEFIPIASNVNLIGVNVKYDNKHKQTVIKKTHTMNETFSTVPNNNEIQLQSYPIEINSEKVFSNNKELIKNLDYYIHYSSGVLFIQDKSLTNIDVSYITPETLSFQEKIKGNGETIAFYLKNTPLLNNSEVLSLQGKILEKNSDYKIENEKGMVVLKYPIPANESLSISYRQLQFENKTFSRETDLDYDVQFAYVRQFAKSQEDVNTKLTSETISSTNFGSPLSIQLANWPLLDDSVSFVLNGADLNPDSLEIDKYHGRLTITKPLLNTTTGELKINYSYYKEFGPQQWNFSGSNRDIDNYTVYNNKTAHRIKSNLNHPIKYDPNHQFIKVEYKKDTDIYKTLKPGLDYDILFNVDPVKEGQILLLLYHERGVTVDESTETVIYGVPSSLGNNDFFKITYYYTNSNVPDAGEIINEQFAIMYNQQLNNNFDYSVEVARSHKEYSKSTKASTDIIIGTGEFYKTYSLSATNIVENSEIIYINNNVAIRDINYYVNYNTGQITFIGLNPGSNDNIRVEYSYYNKESGGEFQKYEQSGSAIAIKTNLKGDIHESSAQLVFVDDSFSPVGSSQFEPGSNILKLASKVNPSKELNFNVDFFTNQTKSNHKSDSTGEFLKYNELKYLVGASYSPLNILSMRGEIDVQNYSTEVNVDNGLRPIDKAYNKYSFFVSSGPPVFKTSFLFNNFTHLDKSNQVNGLETVGRTIELNNDMVLFANDIRLISSLKETTELQTSGNQEISDLGNKKYGFDLAVRPISYLRLNGNYSQENINKKYYQIASQDTKEEAKNYGANVSFTPPINLPIFQKPDYGFALANTEKKSILSTYKPEASQTIANKLSFGLLDLTSVSLRNSLANSLQSNEQINRNAYVEEYTIAGFNLFPGILPITLKPFSKRFSRASAIDDIGNSSTISSRARNWGDSTMYGADWSPLQEYNGSISYALNQNHAVSTENKSTEIIRSTQEKPNSSMTLLNNINVPDIIKTNHTYTAVEDKEQKLTYYLSTSDYSISTITTYNQTSHVYNNSFKNVFLEKTHPIYLNNNYQYDDYLDSSKGIKLRNQEDYELYSNLTLFEKLTIQPKVILFHTNQFTSPSDNYSLNEVPHFYNQRLVNNKLQTSIGASYPFIEKTNFLANVGYDNIKEDIYNRTSVNVVLEPKEFDVYSIGVGLDTTIINGLFLKGTYTLKNSQDKNAQQSAFNGSQTVKIEGNYKPSTLIAVDKVDTIGDVILVILNQSLVSFFLEYNKGTGINSYTVEETETLIGKTVETKIEQVDNLRIKGSFESQVEVSLTEQSNGMIEKFVFTSEAQIVVKNDYANANGISYTIVGLIFSGKLIF